ncbi:BTAD domain-containing putative transcriptional regulator [Umezawaea sp. NPDC059074]|uniref:AfsR/SARP family transcriptional regulator n=1 Tax=Umezawaea sp. NPDC059074 TaxID=3346716 RepID=UPI003682F0AD
MRFRLLGPVAAIDGDGPLDTGPARQRCVLAALAVDAGRVVPVDRLVDRVWGEDPPRHARATLVNYLSRLRVLLAGADTPVTRSPGGYALGCAPSLVDLHRFDELRARARAAPDDGQRVALLEQALGEWQGEALTGVDGDWAAAERDRLHQRRRDAECDLTDARLRLGHGEDLVAALSARAADRPLDERVAAQLVLALHRAGRTADALAHYRRVREELVDQLGTDPGPALRDAHQRVLDADPAPPPVTAAPRQLPAPPRWFTGRGGELARLDQSLTEAASGTVVISAIGGAGGIGKTWLALAWAHRHARRFPDGQLFVDLRGFSPTEQPLAPDAALFGFLGALGVSSDDVPTDLDGRAALYRSLVAGRRILVVLDNAATSEQVVPLLPGGPTCVVLVTGRHELASLIQRHGARHLRLDVLTRQESRALLAARLGADRVAAEPAAVDELVESCGGYPLALSITARTATTRPGVPLAEIAAELRELGLEMFDHDTDPAASLPAVLSWSLRYLTDAQRTVFGLLGIAPGADTTPPATAALADLPPARARATLSALERASLLERRPGGRFAMHDLVRDYATTTAHDLPTAERAAALVRVVDFHLHTARAADRLMDPHRPLMPVDPAAPGVHPLPLPDAAAATAWLEAEHATLLAAQRTAAALGRHHAVWHLAWTLDTFHLWRGHRHDALTAWRAALEAAEHLPDPATLSRTHRLLGRACSRLGRHEEAAAHLDRALGLAVRHRDATEQAHTHRSLAFAWDQQGDDRRALEHARHALDLYHALDQPAWEADALSAAGWYAARLGEFDTAREHCSTALVLHRHHANPAGEAAALDSLGYIAQGVGDHRRAVDHYHQAVDRYRAQGNAYYVAETLDRVGDSHAALGEHDRARVAWREAAALYRDQDRHVDAERVDLRLAGLDRTAEPPR